MSSTETPAAAYVAWYRANRLSRWERIAEGATLDDATNAMLDALAGRRGGESVVLSADRRPNDTAGRRYVGGGRRLL
jgi:hypothetical protein